MYLDETEYSIANLTVLEREHGPRDTRYPE